MVACPPFLSFVLGRLVVKVSCVVVKEGASVFDGSDLKS